MILLPKDEVGKLGLSRGGRVIVAYADDRREELATARGLEVSMLGRSMVTDCVIGPPLCEPLIGQLVLEELDLVVDCARNRLGPRPESPNAEALLRNRAGRPGEGVFRSLPGSRDTPSASRRLFHQRWIGVRSAWHR